MVFISVLIPILAGIVLLALPEKVFKDRKQLLIMTGMSFINLSGSYNETPYPITFSNSFL